MPRSCRFAEALARHGGFSLDTPFEELEPAQQRAILHGTGEAWIRLGADCERKTSKSAARRRSAFQYKGLFPAIDEASRVSFVYRQRLDHLVSEVPCADLRRLAAARRCRRLPLLFGANARSDARRTVRSAARRGADAVSRT